jgi:hypothetical protein
MFERLCHDFLQEESPTAIKSEPTKQEHSTLPSRYKGKKKGTFQKGSQRNPNTKGTFKGKNINTSKIKFFSCSKLGNFSKDCWFRKKYPSKGKDHASTTEDYESKRNSISSSIERENRKQYYLVSTLYCSICTGPKNWLVESGASKNMIFCKAKHVELGDKKIYKIERVGSISFILESRARLHVDEVLYVKGLKKNILSFATLEDKGYWVIFKDMKALLCDKGSHLSTTEPIGTHSGGLYVVS